MTFKNILFPVDLSDRSSAAAKYVRAMAASFDSKITLVHAVEDPIKWYGSTESTKVVEIDLPRMIEESKQALRRFADTEFPGMEVAIQSELADPAELIDRTSETANADLIMMPTRGRGRFRTALLGSVTAKVLHDIPIPIWTEVHQEAVLSEAHLPIENLICAIGLGPESLSVLRFAADFASHSKATMFIAHGIPVTEMRLGKYSEMKLPEYMEDFARDQIEKLQHEAGTAAEVFLAGDPIGEVIRAAAARHKADLVITGRGEIGHFAGLIRAHTYTIIRESPCPVLSL